MLGTANSIIQPQSKLSKNVILHVDSLALIGKQQHRGTCMAAPQAPDGEGRICPPCSAVVAWERTQHPNPHGNCSSGHLHGGHNSSRWTSDSQQAPPSNACCTSHPAPTLRLQNKVRRWSGGGGEMQKHSPKVSASAGGRFSWQYTLCSPEHFSVT